MCLQKFESVQNYKAKSVAKLITYASLYGGYCLVISGVFHASEVVELSTAATNTICAMIGYTAYLSFNSIKKKIIQPTINALTTALT